MKYIKNIDDDFKAITPSKDGRWIVAKPEEAYGLLKWKIRIIKAWAVLRGKAYAFTYSD